MGEGPASSDKRISYDVNGARCPVTWAGEDTSSSRSDDLRVSFCLESGMIMAGIEWDGRGALDDGTIKRSHQKAQQARAVRRPQPHAVGENYGHSWTQHPSKE